MEFSGNIRYTQAATCKQNETKKNDLKGVKSKCPE